LADCVFSRHASGGTLRQQFRVNAEHALCCTVCSSLHYANNANAIDRRNLVWVCFLNADQAGVGFPSQRLASWCLSVLAWQSDEVANRRRAMDWDEAVQKSASGLTVGEDLSTLGIAELEVRVVALRAEIERVEGEIVRKRAQQEAAAQLFKG
jgi:uncharacterized small protein (DUF1192 family)